MTNDRRYYDRLEFNVPMSSGRADTLAAALARRGPGTVLDLGCGWAELLLRVLAAAPDARGTGVDTDERLIARARANAAARGLAERAELVTGDARAARPPADLVLNVGAEHVWGTQAEALAALREMVRPGGVMLFGTGFWQRTPSVAQAAGLGATPEEFAELAGLVDLAVEAGLRPLDIQTANEDEWNAFESGYLSDWEEAIHAGEATEEAVAAADEHRAGWLRGYRGVLGYAYLTLGRPALPLRR